MSDDVVIDKAVVKEILDKTAAVEWGHMEDGLFVPVPKLPLINSGYVQPPFDVKLPNGMVRSIIERPIGMSADPSNQTTAGPMDSDLLAQAVAQYDAPIPNAHNPDIAPYDEDAGACARTASGHGS